MTDPISFAVRQTNSEHALIFLHGFGGDPHHTFGMLPAFVAGDAQLSALDIHCIGYPTSLSPDITGVWAADPDLTTLADYLRSVLTLGSLKQYRRVALIAHSMGGLIAQRAVLESSIHDRVSHLLLFGTPSNGLRKAGLGALFKRQARDMQAQGDFITRLRSEWTQQFGSHLPFEFRAVAGLRDEFVPRTSSVDIFADSHRAFVTGNHLEMVKPRSLDEDKVVLLRTLLTAARRPLVTRGMAATPFTAPTINAAAVAAVSALWPQRQALDTDGVVRLALALEATDRQDDAIRLLEQRHAGDTELTGVLGGRLKRRWLSDSTAYPHDCARARALYADAFAQATREGNHRQAFYNGINEAFLLLAISAADGGEDALASLPARDAAASVARTVLSHTQAAAAQETHPDPWRLATEGEAMLHLGDVEAALARYADALAAGPDTRAAGSMLQQASWVTRLQGDARAESHLRLVFAGAMRG